MDDSNIYAKTSNAEKLAVDTKALMRMSSVPTTGSNIKYFRRGKNRDLYIKMMPQY